MLSMMTVIFKLIISIIMTVILLFYVIQSAQVMLTETVDVIVIILDINSLVITD